MRTPRGAAPSSRLAEPSRRLPAVVNVRAAQWSRDGAQLAILLARLGHIPIAGESLEENGWEFTVLEVDRHRIEQVRVVAPSEQVHD